MSFSCGRMILIRFGRRIASHKAEQDISPKEEVQPPVYCAHTHSLPMSALAGPGSKKQPQIEEVRYPEIPDEPLAIK